jgi:hypothetical protein
MTRAATSRRAAAARNDDAIDDSPLIGYFQRAELPFHSLAFVIPLVIVYEVGTRFHVLSGQLVAFRLMQDFFHLFGASGRYLPAMAVVGILLAWHIARKDPWSVHGGTLLGMAVESVMLCIPLIAIGFVANYYIPPMPLSAMFQWRSDIVNSFGAGVYEELVFRLIAFTLLSFLLLDLFKLPKWIGVLGIVLISSVLFSLYHYLGVELFQWRTFLFRMMAGIYFGVVFLYRGFGITAGSHVAYDVVVHTLPLLLRR